MSDNRKELVRGLISSELTPFTDADAEVLAQFDEERLAAFVEHCSAVATAEPQPEPEPSKLSEDEWLEAAPEALRSLVRKYQAEEQERRAGLIDSLVASQKAWSRDELLAMGTDALQKTAELVKARDYSSRPQAMAEDIGRFEPPDPYRLNERKEAN